MNEAVDKLVQLISNEIEIINNVLDDRTFVEGRKREIFGMLIALKYIIYSDPNYTYPHYFIRLENDGYAFGYYNEYGKWIHLAGATL